MAEEFQTCPQYLANAFSSGDPVWLNLYVGEKIKQGFAVDGNFSEARNQIITALDQGISYLITAAKTEGLNADLPDLQDVLSSVQAVVTADTPRALKVLWIADCLYLDIQSFIAAPLACASLDLHLDVVTTKNSVECHKQVITHLESKSYDAIFYCPFSYRNSVAYGSLFDARRATSNFLQAKSLADDDLARIEA
jgi:hypothetical protein